MSSLEEAKKIVEADSPMMQKAMDAKARWDHYDMLMRSYSAGRNNPGHPYYRSRRRPVKPNVLRKIGLDRHNSLKPEASYARYA